MKDFGWANSWCNHDTDRTPQEIKDCLEEKHDIIDIDVGSQNRGSHHVVKCEICNIMWHYDSSD
jgi:hypothetical protein